MDRKIRESIGKVEFTVFDYLIQIVITEDIVISRNNRAHLIGSKYHERGITKGLHSYNEDNSDCYLFFNPDADSNVISHECFHAVYRMFKWINAEIEEEITAYYLGYLVGEVSKFIDQKPRHKSRSK